MIEAINRHKVRLISELLNRGLPMDPLYALEAVGVKGKDALEVFRCVFTITQSSLSAVTILASSKIYDTSKKPQNCNPQS